MKNLATLSVHSGEYHDPHGAVMPPIYATSTFAQPAPGEHTGYEYSRSGNPTRHALETAIAELEGGTRGYAFASGLAAISTVLELLDKDSHIVAIDDVYGGTYRLIENVRKHSSGLQVSWVKPDDVAGLEAAIRPDTRMIWVETPTNPLLKLADLEAIAEVLRGTDIMVLSDEIYAELTYGQHHVSIANIPDMYERTIVVNGFSKSHAMTGWRMGYLCGPAPLIQQMLKLHQFGIMSAPTTSQYAAIEAMRNGDGDIEKMRDEYDGRRRYLVEGLRRIGLPCFEPKGAFYVFPDIRGTGLSSDDFCERFLMEEKVAVISGSAFGAGGEGFVRCCYATSMKDIAEALTRMDNFLTNLRKKQAREG